MSVNPGSSSLLNFLTVNVEVVLVLSKVDPNSVNSEISNWWLILVSGAGDSAGLSVVNSGSTDKVVLSTEVLVSEHAIFGSVVHLFSWVIEVLSILLGVLVVSNISTSNNSWAVNLLVASHSVLGDILHSLSWVVAVSVWLGNLSKSDSNRGGLVSD